MYADAVVKSGPSPVVPVNGSDRGLLESWKEIATFFGREVRTVQLWEKHEAMPVHRHFHRKQGRIYAYRQELEAWKTASMLAPVQGSRRGEARRAMDVEISESIDEGACSRKLGLLPLTLLHGEDEPRIANMGWAIEDELVVELCRIDLETVVLSSLGERRGEDHRVALVEAMRRLRLCGVLTGTVRREGRRIRVAVQLLTGEELRCVWSERFDSTCESVLDAQAELAGAVGCALPVDKLGIKTGEAVLSGQTSAAEDAYTLGRYFWNQRNEPALRRAEQYLRRAIDLDPQFEPAYAGLADCYVSYSYSRVMPSAAAAAAANRLLRPVLQSQAKDAASLNAIANVMVSCNWDLRTAEQYCRMACEQNANNSRALQLYSMLMLARGRHDESIRYAEDALQLDPLSKVLNNELGYALYFAGDFDRAVPHIQRSIELDPEFVMGHALLGKVEAQRGDWDACLRSTERAVGLSGGASFHVAMLAYAHVMMGDRARGRDLLRSAHTAAHGGKEPWVTLAAVSLAMGDTDEALACLREARVARDQEFMALGCDPRFSALAGRQEFRDLVLSVRLN